MTRPSEVAISSRSALGWLIVGRVFTSTTTASGAERGTGVSVRTSVPCCVAPPTGFVDNFSNGTISPMRPLYSAAVRNSPKSPFLVVESRDARCGATRACGWRMRMSDGTCAAASARPSAGMIPGRSTASRQVQTRTRRSHASAGPLLSAWKYAPGAEGVAVTRPSASGRRRAERHQAARQERSWSIVVPTLGLAVSYVKS